MERQSLLSAPLAKPSAGPTPTRRLASLFGTIASLRADANWILRRCWTSNGSGQDWKSACLCKDAPSDLLACIGSGGQRLYVVPSQELIVVRQGGFGRFRDAEFLRRLFAR
jgi:hypothetical protein